MRLTLSIESTATAQREMTAWFIRSGELDVVMQTLIEAGVRLAHVCFRVVPMSREDRTPRGVVVVSDIGLPEPPPRAESYGCIADKLYLSTHARLTPAVSDAQLNELVPYASAVFHPVTGLIAFDAGEVIRPIELWQTSPRLESTWDKAVAGSHLSPRLKSVDTAVPMTLEVLSEQARDDIGLQSTEELPAMPGEPKDSALGKMFKQSESSAMKTLSRMTGSGGSGGEEVGGGFMGRLHDWASKKAEQTTEELNESRFREIERLLHMLESDPDEGLKYAIPMSMADARGMAPPEGHLAEHAVDFDLKGAGGKEVDPWDLPDKYRHQLMNHYRVLAKRETQLGRFRRAAYIYGNLIGDFHSAARVLRDGSHFEEAAVIYQEKLYQPRMAAECLEKAGHLARAAALYEECSMYLNAAQVFDRLEIADDASRCYRLAVNKYIADRDMVPAAQLLEQKLHVPDEAITLLRETWTKSSKPSELLRELFQIYGRVGRHEEAKVAAKEVCRTQMSQSLVESVTHAMANMVSTYPDRSVCATVADEVRILISQHLRSASLLTSEGITQALAILAPEDMLLKRDILRYHRRRS